MGIRRDCCSVTYFVTDAGFEAHQRFYQSLAVSEGADEPLANTNLRAMPPVRREAGRAQATASNVP